MTELDTADSATAPLQRVSRRAAATVVVVAVGTCTVVTSEMLPVGLLTPLGDTLHISGGLAGLTVTITGLLAMTAPLLMAALGRIDRRWLLPAGLAVVAVGNLLCAVAPNFALLVVGRVLVGAGMGCVWAISGSLGVRLVPPQAVATATSVIFSGIAIASVLGVPAGTYLGALAGWRWAFAAAAGLATVVAVLVAALLPPLPAQRGVSLAQLPGLLGDARLRTGMIVVALLVGGHFAAYTFVRPVLEQRAQVGASTVSALLLGYGITGVLGTFLFGAVASRAPRRAVLVICAGVSSSVAVLAVAGGCAPAAGALLLVWGLAYGGVSVSTQTWTLASAPSAREASSAMLVAVFNAAIGLGSLCGGRTVDAFGTRSALGLGAVLVVGAAAAAILGSAPRPSTLRA